MSDSMKTALGKVRGLGSAKKGSEHWWAQRATSLFLIPLSLWFIFHALPHIGPDYASVIAFLNHPFEAFLTILLISASFYHGQLGLQVIIEDYIHHEPIKIILIFALKCLALLLGIWGILCVLIIQLKAF